MGQFMDIDCLPWGKLCTRCWESLLRFEGCCGEMAMEDRERGQQQAHAMLLRTNYFVEKVWGWEGHCGQKTFQRGTWNSERLNNSLHITQPVRGRTGIEPWFL